MLESKQTLVSGLVLSRDGIIDETIPSINPSASEKNWADEMNKIKKMSQETEQTKKKRLLLLLVFVAGVVVVVIAQR